MLGGANDRSRPFDSRPFDRANAVGDRRLGCASCPYCGRAGYCRSPGSLREPEAAPHDRDGEPPAEREVARLRLQPAGADFGVLCGNISVREIDAALVEQLASTLHPEGSVDTRVRQVWVPLLAALN